MCLTFVMARLFFLHLNARRGDRFAYGSAGVLYQLGETSVSLFKKTFAASWYEVGDAYDEGPNWAHNGSVGLLSETAFGLFFVGGSFGTGQSKLYFSVGQLF